jgi:hypothetical protein
MPFAAARVSRSATLLCACLFAMAANAEMRAMDDGELAAVSGQGMINIDALTYGGFEFTRVNIGGDIKLLSNIDKFRLGTYARSGGGTVSGQDSDIAIDNFALGRVDNANNAGATIVPFEIRDPFIEFAFKNNGAGVREVAGIRIGFGRARGDLSGDILSATGRLDGLISGPASVAAAAYAQAHPNCGLDLGCTLNKIELGIAGDSIVSGHVQLLDNGTGAIDQNGQPINRAEDIGIAKNDSLHTTGALELLLPTLSKQNGDCKSVGLQVCFSLQNYKTIFIGDKADPNLATGGARGAFISLQGQTVPWQDLGNTGNFVNAQSGAFMNFAQYKNDQNKDVYPIMLSLLNALQGTPRVDTCVGGQGC